MTTPEILAFLQVHASEANRTGMARYGINVERAHGVPVAVLRLLAREIGRNPVRKAVNWSLRQIGKRNRTLHKAAVSLAQDLLENGPKKNRWVARDAIRELTNEKTMERIPESTRR